ncbi:MAG: ribonuclease J [Bacilli bacterium]
MSKIKIFALGGLNENGKNMYVVNVDENIFVFDAGLKYPSANMLGVDYIIPKFDYLKENRKKIRGIFLTHAHDGNQGAMPDIMEEFPDVPVYATKFTMTVLKMELEKYNIEATNLKEIRPHSKLDIAGFSIFPITVTHSIPETVAFVLYTNDGAIVYATDFVFDSAMLGAYKTDIGKLAYVGKQGVLCLMAESSYAYREGHTSPKHRISKEVWDILNQTDDRIIISVFPEHVYRIQEIFDEVARTKRKVVIMGKKLQSLVNYAKDFNYLHYNEEMIGDLSNINDKDVVILISDDKEKSFASLEKIISRYDKYITLKEGDTVFIAEPVYPGNEKKIAKIMDDLSRLDVEVITLPYKTHTLHHPSSEDLMQMINLMNPKYYFPIKGEYRYQYMNASVAEQAGMDKDRILLKQNGDVVTFIDGKLVDTKEHINADETLIDGNSSDDIGDLVLKDRELLSKNGIVVVSATIDKKTKKIIADPQILTRGFIYVKDNLDIVEKTEAISKEVIEECINGKKVDFTGIKVKIRERLSAYFNEETGSVPMIITVILEI